MLKYLGEWEMMITGICRVIISIVIVTFVPGIVSATELNRDRLPEGAMPLDYWFPAMPLDLETAGLPEAGAQFRIDALGTGVAANPSNVLQLDYGVSAQTLFSTSNPWVGATDGITPTWFFATEADGNLYRISPAGQVVETVGTYGSGISIRELALNETTGVLYGTDYMYLFTINPDTGWATAVGGMTYSGVWAMDYHAGTDTLYGVDRNTDAFFEIDMDTAAATYISTVPYTRITDLYFHAESGNFYAVTDAAGGDYHFLVDPDTGTFTPIGTFGLNPTGLGNVGPEPPTPTPTPGECINDGDVNMDGEITSADAQMAFEIALMIVIPTYDEACAADCNADEEISAGDAQRIFQTYLGLNNCIDPME